MAEEGTPREEFLGGRPRQHAADTAEGQVPRRVGVLQQWKPDTGSVSTFERLDSLPEEFQRY